MIQIENTLRRIIQINLRSKKGDNVKIVLKPGVNDVEMKEEELKAIADKNQAVKGYFQSRDLMVVRGGL